MRGRDQRNPAATDSIPPAWDTQEVLRRASVGGVSTEFFFWTESRDQADRLAADLQARGHVLSNVKATAVVSVADRTEIDHDAELNALAERYGATYDGHGTYVGPLDRLV